MNFYFINGYGLMRGEDAATRLIASFSKKEDAQQFSADYFAMTRRIAELEKALDDACTWVDGHPDLDSTYALQSFRAILANRNHD